MANNSSDKYIYLVHAIGTNLYKIGKTEANVETVLEDLNSSQSVYPLELVEYINSDSYDEVERKIYDKFSDYRDNGEWFKFSDEIIHDVKDSMNQYKSKADSDNSFGNFIGIGIVAFFIAVIFGSIDSVTEDSIIELEYNEKVATQQEKQLTKNYLVCTDGKSGNDEHLNCQRVVTEYQNKYKN